MVHKPFITEGMHLEHVQRHRRVRRGIEDLLLSWGYRPVETPLLDDYDSYRNHLSAQLESDSYRLIDRSGTVMLLRSDITLFLACQLGRHVTPDELPLRVSYAGNIVRYQSDEEIHSGDTFQAGAELIGVDGTEGDAEILLLAAQLFRDLQIRDAALHIGSRRLLQLAWPDAEPAELEAIAAAVRYRRFDQVAEHSRTAGRLTPDAAVRLFGGIADASYFAPDAIAPSKDTPTDILAEVSRIAELAQLVQELEPDMQVRVDFSEVGAREYYSGMAFQMYCAGAARPVAGGGRYDSLLQDFGCGASSVGFSVVQSVIEPLATLSLDPDSDRISSVHDAGDLRSRHLQAQSMRAEGKKVHL
ncbi:ATP phosphoribosyltransferase regulatory subunit [Spirochaeta africana]|uniref:ATP phosphoribosyltransferase involved in histidine biosynthesis n=1 Tax=Spirochaeta africana (strain ATCC 700263 / DSM 8902 / Z-7692) TaxID=889378 RepID=H9UL72_SPIAZ|nr:ATP phosphoribosyltransferase regulatory subunit [Spirochaeta africana]AFG38265.1 ATP phosphoribosyltransferase involved in histidine biosynthesis [Spirochaeta africana DSM 8902]